ncbi:TetR/AcrR family transcriptional regulator [Stappia indica]|uniref:TetR/AcrR family transcriptional regulator n=1 Tax=Stappia indica TaxID=538381 RepID=UPI001CD6DC37|nr:TetR/AcrR family transcriptional regulator [Stappia indica]MCA1298610.1 TetR/AcrR family transcriptional regulator [Stappia indica]
MTGEADETEAPATPQRRKRSPTRRHKDAPLNEQDWIDAATTILVRENVRGIKIDTLCKMLGVTKGSFYWHFATRNELLVALLSNWRRRMTLNVIRSITRSGEKALERLRNLMALPRQPKSPAFAQIESSIRDWARRVDMPREVVEEVDEIRQDYFERLFRDLGYGPEEARRRGYVTYCLMIGDATLHRTLDRVSQEEFLETALAMLAPPAPAPPPADGDRPES